MIVSLCTNNEALFVASVNTVYSLDQSFKPTLFLEYSSTIRNMTFNDNDELVVALDNKKFLDLELSKRSTAMISFKKDVILSDKSGDVYSYNKDSGLKLLLGHVSIVTHVMIHNNRIYTSDRDRKIRVSHYPNSYNIDYFCLGHLDYITSMALIDDCLISAGAENLIYIWNKGDIIDTIELPHGKIRKMVVVGRVVYLLVENKPLLILFDYDSRLVKEIKLNGSPIDGCLFNHEFIVCTNSKNMLQRINAITHQVLDISTAFTDFMPNLVPNDIIQPSIDYINKASYSLKNEK